VAYETILYLVHGMLHLTGQNDHSEQERTVMRAGEQRIMTALQEIFRIEDIF